jgi:predicted ATPase
MIRRIEALSYRCLRDIDQEIGMFHILVGPNASGKSTLLDAVVFLGDLLRDGLEHAVRSRAPNHADLFWMAQGTRFELAVELEIPESRRQLLPNGYRRARYEIAIGNDAQDELALLGETLWLRNVSATEALPVQSELFPASKPPRPELVLGEGKHSPPGWRKVVTKKATSGNDYFFAETSGWNNPFRLGPRRAGLANLPEDEDRFPVALWVRRILSEGVQRVQLQSEAMRSATPPGSPRTFRADGSNLPLVIEELRARNPERFADWLAHVRTALPDIKDVETIVRDEDKHRYLRVMYESGLRAPSWVVSDGTLRLLALTLLAHVDAQDTIYVVEEPENGIHPQAVECVFRALASAQHAQVMCASHSPVVLSLAEPQQLLCFARAADGATAIIRGDRHPALANWRRDLDLGTLFANGVLG